MQQWNRIRVAAKGLKAIAVGDRTNMAAIEPAIDEVLGLLNGLPTEEAKDELEYQLGKIDSFLASWRPTSDPFYIQPPFARDADDQLREARSLLASLPATLPGNSGSVETPLDTGSRHQPHRESVMRVFISHSSADADISAELISLLRTALLIPGESIRCTSVDGYRLPAGTNSNNQLRREILETDVFIAILTEKSLASTYVLFEMGARWASEKLLVPIVARGVKPSDLKAPLSELHAIRATSDTDLEDLLTELSKSLVCCPRINVTGGS